MEEFDIEEEELNDMDYHSSDKGPWKKIFKTVLLHKKYVVGLLISVILLALLDVCYPLVNSYAIGHYFESTDPNRFDNIWCRSRCFIIYVNVNAF